jgi:8-hydroxy-5-deazaflavin:NADPH oxidoreductase
VSSAPRLAFIGGTGPEGRGLALRFTQVGYPVVIGSRSAQRAQQAASEVRALAPNGDVVGESNHDAARLGELIVLTVPYSGIGDLLPQLSGFVRGKIVISAIAPIEFKEGRPVALRPEVGSAAQEVQSLLSESRVVSAFQTVDAARLDNPAESLDCDVVVCSDDADARHDVMRLANQLPGIRALSGGRLAASRYVEECTALLVTVNRIYKVHTGLRFTGLDR